MWDFKNGDFDLFREELGNVDWDECMEFDTIDEICDTWTSMFKSVAERIISRKRVKVRPADKNWYNNYLRNLRRSKDRDHKVWTKSKTILNWDIYRNSRNKYFQECERIKIEFEEHIYSTLSSEITKNPKKWWSLVGNVMGSSKKSQYPAMVRNGQIYSTDKEKAEAFNETYLESSSTVNDDYELPNENMFYEHETLDNIEILEKDVEDVLKCINVNKAYGPDGVSPRLIKEAGPSITKILTRIFNKSLQLAKFPLAWKRANVLPIFKKAEMFITTNYRPVSLLSILAKIFEKIVFKYLYNYFRDHFLISLWQSGFMPGSSTVTQLTEIYDQFCKAVSDGKEIRVVFLDISKAFDRVWHKGLLYKLKSCGITGRLLEWLKDYLSDRQQRVIINGEYSEWGKINAGVPQGSVLGPLLFLIFINDITHVIRNCKIRLFADDTCLFLEVEDPDTTADLINDDLGRLNE
jgi:L-rhamnose mutarotase